MRAGRVAIIVVLLLVCVQMRADQSVVYTTELKPLLTHYCYDCHGDGEHSGEFAMDECKSAADLVKDKGRWDKAVHYARAHMMPPPDADALPTPDDRDRLVAAIQRILYNIDPDHPDPGRVTIRRLNVAEYRNTIRDLVGVNFDPALDFPQDDTGYGFDNIGDVLSLPPMLLEKYLAAANTILDQAIVTDVVEPRERHIPATQALFSRKIEPSPDGSIRLTSDAEDSLSVSVQTQPSADYILRVLAYATVDRPPDRPPLDRATSKPATTTVATTDPTTQAVDPIATGPMKLSLMRNGIVFKEFEITADAAHPQWVEARIDAPTRGHEFTVAVRRLRGLHADTIISDGRIGQKQPGSVNVKEIVVQGPAPGAVRRFTGQRLQVGPNAQREAEAIVLPTVEDEVSATFEAPTASDYLLRAQAHADYCGDEFAKMEMLLDGKTVATFNVNAPSAFQRLPGQHELPATATRAVPQVYETKTNVDRGEHRLSVRFINDRYEPTATNPNYRDRNLIVQALEAVDLSAPTCPPMPPKIRAMFVRHAGAAAAIANANISPNADTARAILADFMLRAWRHPPTSDDVDRVMKLYQVAREDGQSFHASVKHAMTGVLVSSEFLFRGEPLSPASSSGAPELIGEYELASRLSYFLWSSMPDDELLDLAKRGQLRTNLDAQVKRMMASPKFEAFTENFAGQWLQFRNLDASEPDRNLFPDFNERLRDSMQKETELFVDSILHNDRSLMEILTGDYTYVNEQLATLYGIKDVSGKEFRRISLNGTNRRGVLTQGSVLTLTSNPTRTSPVKRGKWVMENLLGTSPPPPPPNIPPLIEPGHELTGTLRQQLEKHRADPTCASCHAAMDPIGLSLENFNAIGSWRDRDNDGKIDASAELSAQDKINGPVELVDALAKTRENDFLRSVVEHCLTFALGRGVEPYDQPAVDKIIADLKAHDARFSVLVDGIVHSVPFQMRRGNANGS